MTAHRTRPPSPPGARRLTSLAPCLSLLLLAPGLGWADAPPPAAGPPIETSLLPTLLAGDDPALATVRAAPETFRAQVLLSEVKRGPKGKPTLVRHGWRVDAEYTYPASAMKLLAGVAALQRARTLGKAHRWFSVDTPLAFHPVFEGERLDTVDPSNRNGRHITLRQLVRRMAIVSSNYAFNRLYDFAGQTAVNQIAWDAGLRDTLVLHRLSRLMPLAEHRRHPAIELRGPRKTVTLPAHTDGVDRLNPTTLKGIEAGVAERIDRKRVEGPKSFVEKNRMSTVDLQNMLVFLLRPDVDLGLPGFKGLHRSDRALLKKAMLQRPGQSKNPVLPESRYDPNRFKPSRPGLLRVLPNEGFDLYNKAGKAYGFRIENAYVVEHATKRAFFLTVVIYVNANGVLNDGAYEYDEIADPFIHAVAERAARHLWRGRSSGRPR